MSRRKRLKEVEKVLEIANSRSDEDFVRNFLINNSEKSSGSWASMWKHPRTDILYNLSLSQTQETSDADLEACFLLVEETSRKDYEASSRGWNSKSKRKEMRDSELRYIIVKDSAGQVCGYTSFMPTMEEGQAVVYCYEIHLKPELRSTGLAGLLMGFLEMVASNISVMEKVMLTVFTCNTRAVDFYRSRGFDVDDISPRRRKLRNGIVKEPDYAIMSKCVERVSSVMSGDDKSKEELSQPTKTVKLEQAVAENPSAADAKT